MGRKIFKETKMSNSNIFRSKANENAAKIWRDKNYKPKDPSKKGRWGGYYEM